LKVALLISHIPDFGMYQFSFYAMTKRFAKMFAVFLCCFIGFTTSIFVILAEKPNFNGFTSLQRIKAITARNTGSDLTIEGDGATSIIAHI